MKIKLGHILEILILATLVYIYFIPNGRYNTSKHITLPSESILVRNRSINMKYALVYTSPLTPSNARAFRIGKGQETFIERKCAFQNCFTTDQDLFHNISEFDAILFHGPEMLDHFPEYYLPSERPSTQIYIFVSRHSSDNYGVFDNRFNNVFNYTWTYKLDSDINFANIVIRDRKGRVVGPNVTVPWINLTNMSPITDTVKKKLASKSIAAAWFVATCHSKSGREKIVDMVSDELKRYDMTVHVYGECKDDNVTLCPRNSMGQCMQKLERDYYFYLAFENSFGEDYVTKQLLIALQHYAVPIVYGGADYERFMPRGTYLDINKMSVEYVVAKMVEAIRNKTKYYEYFKWRNHYSYHYAEERPETDPYCSLCRFLHNVDYNKTSVVKNFYEWWNNPDESETYL